MTNDECCRGVRRRERLTNGLGARRYIVAFTLIELIVVTAVIIILTGLVLSTVGYVQKKGARARAEIEIAAMSAALESYKADNGVYPRDIDKQYRYVLMHSRQLNMQPLPSTSSFYLYSQLAGDSSGFRWCSKPGLKSICSLSQTCFCLGQRHSLSRYRDPFGNSYGYSTANQVNPLKGYNPTFDLWSTAGTAPRLAHTDSYATGSLDQKLVARELFGAHGAPLQKLPNAKSAIRNSFTLRSCAPQPPHGGWDSALRLIRLATHGISLRRNRAFRFAQD